MGDGAEAIRTDLSMRDWDEMLTWGTVGLCDECAKPVTDPSLPEAERLTGFSDCDLCGEKAWADGRYTGKVRYYRPRTAVERLMAAHG